MRNARPENLSEHAMEVGIIAHALCTIGNVRLGKHLNADRAALIGLFHDASEIITGDMPTPIKYSNPELKTAYKEVEAAAANRLLDSLPEDLREAYEPIFFPPQDEKYLRGLVKAADKLSAYLKCLEEAYSGNGEFKKAGQSTWKKLQAMQEDYPELKIFMEEFLQAYGKTLDELL